MKSVQNIGQITKAMELVAATKMRRSQELALNSRPYSYTALELLGTLSKLRDVAVPGILVARPVERTAFVIITSDKGLAGSFNSAVFRSFEQYVRAGNIDIKDPRYSFVAVGQKAKSYLERRKMNVLSAFTRVGDFTKMEEVKPISDLLINGYLRRDFDSVTVFFTTFVTALRQDGLFGLLHLHGEGGVTEGIHPRDGTGRPEDRQRNGELRDAVSRQRGLCQQGAGECVSGSSHEEDSRQEDGGGPRDGRPQ